MIPAGAAGSRDPARGDVINAQTRWRSLALKPGDARLPHDNCAAT